jgi:hypothetical protein
MRLIRAHNPDVIVSTYPGVTAVLGDLRHKRKLKVPCYSSITDLAGLHFWAHPGIDMHFVTHPESIEEVEQIAGPGSVQWAKPPTSPAFLAARSRADARRSLALPAEGTVIAVSGGGWGVGDLVGATRAALEEAPEATVLCLCGRNDDLRRRVAQRFPDEPRLRVMGFTDRMGDVLAAADALIHSSAGLTVLEAIIRGCPVISYGFGVGHVRASNRALQRFGLAQVARHEADLGPALAKALEHRPEPDGSFARRPSTASLIMGSERRITPLPAWRVWTPRAAYSTAATLLILAAILTSGISYRFLSNFVHMRPVTSVNTGRPEVGVLVDTANGEVPGLASALAASGMHVSFAIEHKPSSSDLSALHFGDQAVPRLPAGGLLRWLKARSELHKLLHSLGFDHNFLYASGGPSLGQWFMAHQLGGQLIAGAVKVEDIDDSIRHFHPGEVVEINASNGNVLPLLEKLHAELDAQHLSAVPVGRLFRDSGEAV